MTTAALESGRTPARRELDLDGASRDGGNEEGEAEKLTELLNETRILLPGTEVFLGFLTTLPFSQHFSDLDGPRRWVFLCTFFSTVLSLVLFVVPAAYHRLARPIRHKARFKAFANRFLVAGLVPMSISIVLATYLVSYVVIDGPAVYIGGAVATLIVLVWWAVPLLRLHDRHRMPEEDRRRTVTEGDDEEPEERGRA